MRHNKTSYHGSSPVVCTSTTRPPNPSYGQKIIESDTGNILYYYGATTGWVPPWNVAWGRVGYVAGLSDLVTYPNVDLGSITFNAIKNRHYKYTYYTPKQDVNSSSITYSLTDGANAAVNGYAGTSVAYTAAVGPVTITFEEQYSATAASITRKIRAAIGTASGTHTNFAKMYFLAEDIGPFAAPA
jgi:hypothetical protein